MHKQNPKNRRVTTSVIRMECEQPNAHYHPLLNRRYLYGWMQIRYSKGSWGFTQEWLYRFNFSLQRVEAVPF